MYVGEGAVYHATSPDLLSWTVGDTPILEGRAGAWDEHLVEVGAPPVVVGDRLVMLVNGARIVTIDPPVVDYRCGAVAFALDDPTRMVVREEEPWLAPSTPEEKAGLVPNVTFVEGLVSFRGQWLAYYGQSDTTTAVALAPQ